LGTGLAKDPEAQSQMMEVVARTYQNLGLYPRAHELVKRALDARLSFLGPDDPKTLRSMIEFGWILERERHDVEAGGGPVAIDGRARDAQHLGYFGR
jgi:eukaryotic-like serine/threonine-protein kinase